MTDTVDKTKMLEAAVSYAQRGWPVFPCKVSKEPYTKRGHLDATTNIDQIKSWWSRWPEAGIGFAPPADIVILDIDIKHDQGKFGDETLADWEQKHGELPDTVLALTGGGGKHYFFTTPHPLGCKNGLLPSIDLKTKGGYVILPPSMHSSGKRYEWDVLQGLDDVPIAPIPGPMLGMISETLETNVTRRQEVPKQILEGERNTTLFRLACSLRAKGFSETAILAAISQTNEESCLPPLSDREVKTLVNSSAKYKRGELHGRPPDMEEEKWEEPIPFETIDTPDFPTDSLPGPVAAFVKALAESTQTPEEMAAVLSLGVLATAFQSRYEVQITPDWREPLCLYTVAIAPPGERKSPVISALTEPVHDYEAFRQNSESVEIAQNRQEKRMLEKALANAENAATKAQAPDKVNVVISQERQNAIDLAEQLANFREKHPFRLLVDDTTPEKLVDIMDMQGGCITLASSEGGVFDSLAGRYDRGANLDIYLKGHVGESVTIDRIGRKSNHVRRPRLTMILTIQPEVLNGLMGNTTFRGRGLCGRFLYAMCRSKVGFREVSPQPIPPVIRVNYYQFIQQILSGQDIGTIRLNAEAHQIRLDYMACVEQRLGGEWEHMRDWAAKLVGAMLRIAALIHASSVLGNPTEALISAETIEAAVKIAEFLGVHAMAAYQVMGADEGHEDAKYLLRKIESTGQDEISKRDLFQLVKGKCKKVEKMEPGLRKLIEYGYIRIANAKTGGRPTDQIKINPLFLSSIGYHSS